MDDYEQKRPFWVMDAQRKRLADMQKNIPCGHNSSYAADMPKKHVVWLAYIL
jgi:hypothetical protein